jgi:hypothetical protein
LAACTAPANPDSTSPLDWSPWLSGFAKEFTSEHLKVPLNLLIDQLIRGSVSQLLDPASEAVVRNRHAQLLKGAIEGVHKATGELDFLVEVSLPIGSLFLFNVLYSCWMKCSRTTSLLSLETSNQSRLLTLLLRICKPEVLETQPPRQPGLTSWHLLGTTLTGIRFNGQCYRGC